MIYTFNYQDKAYEFDDERMGLGEARWVKQEIGMTGAAFFESCRTLDPDAVVCLLVMAMRRAGETVEASQVYADDDNGYFKLITSMDVRAADTEE